MEVAGRAQGGQDGLAGVGDEAVPLVFFKTLEMSVRVWLPQTIRSGVSPHRWCKAGGCGELLPLPSGCPARSHLHSEQVTALGLPLLHPR